MVTGPLRDLPDRLRGALAGRVPVALEDEAARHAAVAIVLSVEAEPAILFVKRLEREADPWSGHAAFPGGFRAHPGESPPETAQRETEEETGLALGTAGTLVGRLDDVYPRSVHLPKVVVTPCVFTVPGRLAVRAVGEIDRAIWVPANEVFSLANRHPFELALPTETRQFESIHAGGLVIWGLTERILQQIVTLFAA